MIEENVVHAGQHGVAGDGGAGNGIHAFAVNQRTGLADELAPEGFFLGLGAVAGGFGEAVVTDDDLGDHAVFIQLQFHIYIAGKALAGGAVAVVAQVANGGSAFNAEACQRADIARSLIDAAHNGAGRNGSGGNGVDLAFVLLQINRQLLALELLGESSFLGFGAQTGGFLKGSAAHVDAKEHALAVGGHGDFHITGEALDGNGVDVADHFACGVHALIYGVKLAYTNMAALADKLRGKGSIFLGLQAKAGGLFEVGILTDLRIGDNAVVVHGDLHLNRTGEALDSGSGSAGLAVKLVIRFIESVHDRVGRNSGACDGVNALHLHEGFSVSQQRFAHSHSLVRFISGNAVLRAVMGEGQRQRRHHRNDRQHDPCGQCSSH